jgi:hypothetical protein
MSVTILLQSNKTFTSYTPSTSFTSRILSGNITGGLYFINSKKSYAVLKSQNGSIFNKLYIGSIFSKEGIEMKYKNLLSYSLNYKDAVYINKIMNTDLKFDLYMDVDFIYITFEPYALLTKKNINNFLVSIIMMGLIAHYLLWICG